MTILRWPSRSTPSASRSCSCSSASDAPQTASRRKASAYSLRHEELQLTVPHSRTDCQPVKCKSRPSIHLTTCCGVQVSASACSRRELVSCVRGTEWERG